MFDGLPSKDTIQKVYDNLDFMRDVEVFLNTMPGASLFPGWRPWQGAECAA